MRLVDARTLDGDTAFLTYSAPGAHDDSVTRSEHETSGSAAREALLVREKEHTRLGDELARQRRELPWVRVEKDYRFDTDDGEKTTR